MHIDPRDVLGGGDEVHVRGLVVEHFGNDLLLAFENNGAVTKVLVARSQIVECPTITPESKGGGVPGTKLPPTLGLEMYRRAAHVAA